FPPREDNYSDMLAAIERVFDWQRNPHPEDNHTCDAFTLMFTTHLNETDYKPGAITDIKRIANDNITNHPQFSAAFQHKFGHLDPFAIGTPDFPMFFSVILPKVISAVAQRYGWFGHPHWIYIYARPQQNYSIMS